MSTKTKQVVSNAQFEALLDLYEKQMRTLEIEYEKYFNGSERRPPENLHKQVRKLHRDIDQTFTTSTALKFRARNLHQRLVTLQTHWNRIMRQIEEGTYIRDKRKAARQKAQIAQQQADQEAYDLSQDLGDLSSFSFDDLAAEIAATIDQVENRSSHKQNENNDFGLSQPRSRRPTPSGPPSHQLHPRQQHVAPPQNTTTDPFAAQRIQQPTPTHQSSDNEEIYRRYIEARRQCNQSTEISYDKLMSSIESQKARIREKKGVTDVNFDVVIKDGQAFLKPSAKD